MLLSSLSFPVSHWQIICACCAMSAGFEYVGSGSNRNFCFADLLLRQNNTDVTQLSAANWGVIEVKGPWQLSLLEDVSLGDALNHPGYRKAVLCAVQQVITALNRLQCSDVVCARRRFGFGHLQCWQQLMVPLTYVAAVCDCCAYRPTCVLGFVSGHQLQSRCMIAKYFSHRLMEMLSPRKRLSLPLQTMMSPSFAIVSFAMRLTSVSGHLHQFHGMARACLLVQLGCTSWLLGSSAMMLGSRVIYHVTVFPPPHHQVTLCHWMEHILCS